MSVYEYVLISTYDFLERTKMEDAVYDRLVGGAYRGPRLPTNTPLLVTVLVTVLVTITDPSRSRSVTIERAG